MSQRRERKMQATRGDVVADLFVLGHASTRNIKQGDECSEDVLRLLSCIRDLSHSHR